MYASDSYLGIPGIRDAVETFHQVFTWGREENVVRVGAQVSGAARDAGNTPTTELRPGLLLGAITAQPGLYKQYDPTATDGSQVVVGILMVGIKATDNDGTNTNRFCWIMAAGPVKANALIGLDAVARSQMRGRFLFDDDLQGRYQYYGNVLQEVAKTTSYTVVASDAGTLFTTLGASGAVTFTLPALSAGAGPFAFLNMVDQNMTVAAAGTDKLVALNNVSASSVSFSTANQKIGSQFFIYGNQLGTKWIVENRSAGTATVTVA